MQKRDERTQAAADAFQKRTGIAPEGARKHVGSMSEYVTIKVKMTDYVRGFCENFHRGPGPKLFRGVPVTYIGNFDAWSPTVTFDIKRTDLIPCSHETVIVKQRITKGQKTTHGARLCTKCGMDTRGMVGSEGRGGYALPGDFKKINEIKVV